MGLFGGFKAKFTKNSSSKEKPQDVVCLKYHIHSEFDRQEPPIPPLPIQNNIKKNEVVRNNSKAKSRKALAKSAIFQESDTSLTSLSSPNMAQKSLSLTNLNSEPFESLQINDASNSVTVSTTFEMPINGASVAVADTKFGRSVGHYNGLVSENVAIVTNKHMYSTNDDSKTEKHEKAILSTFSTHDEDSEEDNTQSKFLYMSKQSSKKTILNPPKEEILPRNLDNEQSTLIFMTQHSSRNSFDRNMENSDDDTYGATSYTHGLPRTIREIEKSHNDFDDDQDDNFNFTFVQHKTTNDDEDFRVNVVKHDYNRSYSFSEDEKSYQEEEPMDFIRMGYSSQAASIFFGEDVEPEIARPRRLMLTEDDDERRSSGADC